MPFSQSSQLSIIVGFMETTQPQSVLDVGVGFGQYGFLARTNLEHINLFEVNGAKARKRSKEEWRVIIDGIEGFAPYITPVHEYAYNNILIGDALELLPKLESQYDLILAIDILEHFDKEHGLTFLSMIKQLATKHVLLSTPKDFIEQHEEANPYEDHRSHWVENELLDTGFTRILPNDDNWIAVHEVSDA
tara:strand:- start:329 stop:901 length:573 start_codon:yes stop_codon:yes gene_type:complete